MRSPTRPGSRARTWRSTPRAGSSRSSGRFRGFDVAELPPPTQGVAVLEALAILGDEPPGLPDLVRAIGLALEDALGTVRDGADVGHLLSPEHVRARRGQMPARVAEPAGGTVCVCAVDCDRMAVSLLQSLYEPFGSGVVAGSTGVVLNNRAAGFAVQGTVIGGTPPVPHPDPGDAHPRRRAGRPVRTDGRLHPGPVARPVPAALLPDGDPQVAIDRGRFRIDGSTLSLEQPLWDRADELARLGFRVLEGDRARRRSAAVRRSSCATGRCSAARTPARTAARSAPHDGASGSRRRGRESSSAASTRS